MNILKPGKYIRENHLDLLAVLFAAIACYFAYVGIKLAQESIRLTNESAADTAKQIKASQDQLKTSQDQLDLFKKNLDIARTQLESFREFEKETFAKPDFAIRFRVTAFDPNAPFPIKPFGKPFGPEIKQSSVEYGKPCFVSVYIQNTGAAPARNVTVVLSALNMNVFDQVGDNLFRFEREPGFPGDLRGTVTARYSAMHQMEQNFLTFPVIIKASTPDGAAQFTVNVEGDNLKKHYSQALVLRRLSKTSPAADPSK